MKRIYPDDPADYQCYVVCPNCGGTRYDYHGIGSGRPLHVCKLCKCNRKKAKAKK